MVNYYTGDEKKDRIIFLKVFSKIVLVFIAFFAIILFIKTGKLPIKIFFVGSFIIILLLAPISIFGYIKRIKNPQKIKEIRKKGLPKWLAFIFVFGGAITILINTSLIFLESLLKSYDFIMFEGFS